MKCSKSMVVQRLLRINKILSLIVLISFTALAEAGGVVDRAKINKINKHQGVIYISPNGPDEHGDFGMNTPGTTTAGIQEAFDYAVSFRKHPHVEKHIEFRPGFYNTTETIRIPWLGERAIVDATKSHISYMGETGDAIVIDSQMNARLLFGYISSLSSKDGWIARLKPEDSGPSTDSNLPITTPVMTCCVIKFNAIVSKKMFEPDNPNFIKQRSNGLFLDASEGPIIGNEISISELNTCGVGVYLKDNSGFNRIDVPFAHGCNTHLQIGDAAQKILPYDNRVYMTINSEGVPDSIGARIFGERNTLDLSVVQTAPKKGIIFEPQAKDNIVYASRLPYGFTNNATVPTNRIITNFPIGFDIATPAFPVSGKKRVNRNPYVVEISMLTSGDVSGWTLTDAKGASQSFSSGLSVGQSFTLTPGDSISFDFRIAPTWTWRAIK